MRKETFATFVAFIFTSITFLPFLMPDCVTYKVKNLPEYTSGFEFFAGMSTTIMFGATYVMYYLVGNRIYDSIKQK